ncbi:hypothetical protein PQ465_15375 [Sphingobacterium oryzagri]|uniref:Virulence factor SrfB n=1 Tax=Sphingobacterium oryzagri TaxID=3025669 RepID=A0ABY7WDE9_9SPHI|nr:hypothetical protein [Sphingobacterium sp. KACC 22765]WDF67681.1 hypothetical protein PQ465_15375 [Sphingobacterium sp. KACC 22765]
MSKVFRLFEGAGVTHWETRAGDYNNNVIREIQGGDGDKTHVLPTSIPSPFARLDLFRSAFKTFENPTISLDGDTNNHRIVSECLDLLELLYNYDSVADRIRIVAWDKTIDLSLLYESRAAGHQLLGKTLSLFLSQDRKSFHFDALKRFYIIYFDGLILGGTSPKTLVFTTANPKRFANITVENDTLFSGIIKPLYKRNPGFVKYLVSLFKENDVLRECMGEFDAYVRQNFQFLRNTDHTLYKELDEADLRTLNDYAEIEYNNTLTLEIFGVPLRKIKKISLLEKIQQESEFLLHADKKFEDVIPMVLASNGSLGHLNYLNANTKWDVNQKVESTNLPFNQRKLPGKDIRYPYLTIDDFLTNELYETPYPINVDFFFDGNFVDETGEKSVGYLLPLKPLFFECFSESVLWNKKFKGKPMIEILKRRSFVQVTLRIPINAGNDFIELMKRYEYDGVKETYGKIVSCQKYVQFFPFQKSAVTPNYYLNLLDAEENDTNQALELTFDGEPAAHTSLKSRLHKANAYHNTHFYRIKQNFSLIGLRQCDAEESNYLIPKWDADRGIDSQFTFSIDFGTSNTHIEYAVNAGEAKPLDFATQNNGLAKTYYADAIEGEERLLLEMEFIPEEIGRESEFLFPVRTVLFDYHNYEATSYQAFLDYNIGFSYEKRRMVPTNRSRAFTNLKWISNNVNRAEQEAQVNSFLEQLIVMCKTKVMVEGGDISATRFVWTYPLSYGTQQITNLAEMLKMLIKRHFGEHVSIDSVCESIAPFYAITKEGRLLGTSNHILSLDIGGGTIDSVVYQNKKVKTISSMLFGANFLYANGYETAIDNNGFYKLGETFLNDLPDDVAINIQHIKKNIKDTNKLEDLISFYFSLEKHKELKGKTNVSFSKILAGNSAIRTVLLFYYASIIYYNVRAMQVAGLEKPTKLIFSGNGSRFLSMLDRLDRKEILAEYTNALVDAIYKQDVQERSDIQIITYANPKELTSRGAISIVNEKTEELLEELSIRNIKKSFVTYLGDASDTLVSSENPLRYQDLDNRFNESTYKEYEGFVRLFVDLKGISLRDLFDITVDLKQTFEPILLNKNRAVEYLETGIELRKKQVNIVDDISDPFFFYIVRGMLSDMLKKLMPNEN